MSSKMKDRDKHLHGQKNKDGPGHTKKGHPADGNTRKVNGDTTQAAIDKYMWTEDEDLEVGKEKKRLVHNSVEKKRKEKIKTGIQKIGELLPWKEFGWDVKTSTNEVLERALQYITHLKEQNTKFLTEKGTEAQAEEIKKLRKQVEELKVKNACLSDMLLQKGVQNNLAATWRQRMSGSANLAQLAATMMANETQTEGTTVVHGAAYTEAVTGSPGNVDVSGDKQSNEPQTTVAPAKPAKKRNKGNLVSEQLKRMENAPSASSQDSYEASASFGMDMVVTASTGMTSVMPPVMGHASHMLPPGVLPPHLNQVAQATGIPGGGPLLLPGTNQLLAPPGGLMPFGPMLNQGMPLGPGIAPNGLFYPSPGAAPWMQANSNTNVSLESSLDRGVLGHVAGSSAASSATSSPSDTSVCTYNRTVASTIGTNALITTMAPSFGVGTLNQTMSGHMSNNLSMQIQPVSTAVSSNDSNASASTQVASSSSTAMTHANGLTSVTQSLNIPIMSTHQTGFSSMPSMGQVPGMPFLPQNPNMPMTALSAQQPYGSLQGTLVLQNGQLILLNDPAMLPHMNQGMLMGLPNMATSIASGKSENGEKLNSGVIGQPQAFLMPQLASQNSSVSYASSLSNSMGSQLSGLRTSLQVSETGMAVSGSEAAKVAGILGGIANTTLVNSAQTVVHSSVSQSQEATNSGSAQNANTAVNPIQSVLPGSASSTPGMPTQIVSGQSQVMQCPVSMATGTQSQAHLAMAGGQSQPLMQMVPSQQPGPQTINGMQPPGGMTNHGASAHTQAGTGATPTPGMNQQGGFITVNTTPSHPNQLPSALILPNGQVVPVVTQPQLLFQSSVNGNGLVMPGNPVNSQMGSMMAVGKPSSGPGTSMAPTMFPQNQGMATGGLQVNGPAAGMMLPQDMGSAVQDGATGLLMTVNKAPQQMMHSGESAKSNMDQTRPNANQIAIGGGQAIGVPCPTPQGQTAQEKAALGKTTGSHPARTKQGQNVAGNICQQTEKVSNVCQPDVAVDRTPVVQQNNPSVAMTNLIAQASQLSGIPGTGIVGQVSSNQGQPSPMMLGVSRASIACAATSSSTTTVSSSIRQPGPSSQPPGGPQGMFNQATLGLMVDQQAMTPPPAALQGMMPPGVVRAAGPVMGASLPGQMVIGQPAVGQPVNNRSQLPIAPRASNQQTPCTAGPVSVMVTGTSSTAPSSVPATPTSSSIQSLPTTATAVITSNGTILLTLAPPSNPTTQTGGMVFDPSSIPLITAMPGQSGSLNSATKKGGKKSNHRMLMPKPPSFDASNPMSNVGIAPQAMSSLWNTPLFPAMSDTETDSNNTESQTESAKKEKNKKTSESSAPLQNKETLTVHASTAEVPTTTAGTDILAKAAESIFSSSLEISPTIGGFYNSTHEDNPLHIDTSAGETDEGSVPSPHKGLKPTKSGAQKPNKTKTLEKSNKNSKNVQKSTPKSHTSSKKQTKANKEKEKSPVSSAPVPEIQEDTGGVLTADIGEMVIDLDSCAESTLDTAVAMEISQPAVAMETTSEKPTTDRPAEVPEQVELPAQESHKSPEVVSTSTPAASPAQSSPMPNFQIGNTVSSPVNPEIPLMEPPATTCVPAKPTPTPSKNARKRSQSGKKIPPPKPEDLLPETITFSESELCDVLDQVESLGESYQPQESSSSKKSRNRKSKNRTENESMQEDLTVSKKRKKNMSQVEESILLDLPSAPVSTPSSEPSLSMPVDFDFTMSPLVDSTRMDNIAVEKEKTPCKTSTTVSVAVTSTVTTVSMAETSNSAVSSNSIDSSSVTPTNVASNTSVAEKSKSPIDTITSSVSLPSATPSILPSRNQPAQHNLLPVFKPGLLTARPQSPSRNLFESVPNIASSNPAVVRAPARSGSSSVKINAVVTTQSDVGPNVNLLSSAASSQGVPQSSPVVMSRSSPTKATVSPSMTVGTVAAPPPEPPPRQEAALVMPQAAPLSSKSQTGMSPSQSQTSPGRVNMRPSFEMDGSTENVHGLSDQAVPKMSQSGLHSGGLIPKPPSSTQNKMQQVNPPTTSSGSFGASQPLSYSAVSLFTSSDTSSSKTPSTSREYPRHSPVRSHAPPQHPPALVSNINKRQQQTVPPKSSGSHRNSFYSAENLMHSNSNQRHNFPPQQKNMFPAPHSGGSENMMRAQQPESFGFTPSFTLSDPPATSAPQSAPFSMPSGAPSSTFSFNLAGTTATTTVSSYSNQMSTHHQFPFYPLHPSVGSSGGTVAPSQNNPPAQLNLPNFGLDPSNNTSNGQSNLSGSTADNSSSRNRLMSPPQGQSRSNYSNFAAGSSSNQGPVPPGDRPQFMEPQRIGLSHPEKELNSRPLPSVPQSQAGASVKQSQSVQGPHRSPAGNVNRSPHMMSEMGSSFYTAPNFQNAANNPVTSPPLHHPVRPAEPPGNQASRQQFDRPFSAPQQFSPVPTFTAPTFEPPPLQYSRESSSNSQPASFSSGHNSTVKKSSSQGSSEPSRPKNVSKQDSKQRAKQKKMKQFEVDTNLSNSIFESTRSVTPYFPLSNLSPPPRNLPPSDGPTYIPGNLFSNPPRPLSNSNMVQHKGPEMNPPFNPLFTSTRPTQNGLGLNFQPSFPMSHMHGNHGNTSQITPHSNAVSVTPHVPNFNLSNIFSDMNNPNQGDSINISPIKFPQTNPILPPPHPSMDHNALQHHHQPGPIYHNRPHPPTHPPVIHNAMNINSILGHNPHHGFDGRPMGPGMNTSAMGPAFAGHGHPPTFGMPPPLNFSMHDH